MKVLLIDNEAGLRKGLRTMLQAYCPEVTVIEEADGVQNGLLQIKKVLPDMVLLDVEMDDGTGFDLMRQVTTPLFQLVFITAHNKYAVEAFKFSAIDYLLKPVDPEALQKSILKAEKNIRSNNLQQQVEVLLNQLSGIQNKDRKIVLKDIDNT